MPTHRSATPPREILLDDWLKPAKMTQLDLAKKMGVDVQLVNAIINRRRSVTAKTALLLAKVLKTTPELWLNAQMAVDLWAIVHSRIVVSEKSGRELLKRLERRHKPTAKLCALMKNDQSASK
ncbi:MAG: HigA family addiction module antitoxin [Polyangiaceae bacterium]